MSGPMDPGKLDGVRYLVDHNIALPLTAKGTEWLSELLEAHDHHSKRADAAEDALGELSDALTASRIMLQAARTGKGLRGLLDDAEREREELRALLLTARNCAVGYRDRVIERDGAGLWPDLPWNE